MIETILQNFFEAFNKRDLAKISALYAQEALIHGRDGPLRGVLGIQTIISRWLQAFPDLLLTPLYATQEGDVVVVHWRAEGLHEQALLDIPASKEKAIFHGLTCFRIADHLVVEHWACTDYRALRGSLH